MKIISWNCSGGFRKKTEALLSLDADVYCIQECESPEKHERMFDKKLGGYDIIWKGEDPKRDKGIAVIAKPEIGISRLEWPGGNLRDFLPVSIAGTDIVIVNIWACKPYIEMFNLWTSQCWDFINESVLLIGDFNSPSKNLLDPDHGKERHIKARKNLSDKGLVSAYHYLTGAAAGKETQPTFFMHRNIDKPYVVDYAFAAPYIIKDFGVLGHDWLEHSDHVPIMIEIDEDAIKIPSKVSRPVGSYKTDSLPLDMDSDIDHMVATYAGLKDLEPDIAAKVLLSGEILENWRKRNIEPKQSVFVHIHSNI